jgi:hypothetical protein
MRSQLLRLLRVVEHEAVFTVANVIDSAVHDGDETGQAAGHALQHGVGEGVVLRGMHEPVGSLIQLHEIAGDRRDANA